MVNIKRVPAFYQGYVSHVQDMEIIEAMKESIDDFWALCKDLSEAQALHRYEEGKWSIKDLIQHLTDAERVFAYRAMRFARLDATELSGFDHDEYVSNVYADRFALKDLLAALSNIRQSSVDLFTTFSETELSRTGIANGLEMTVEMIGYIISGHMVHHTAVIQEKYLT